MLKFVALWNVAPGLSEAEFEDWYRRVHVEDARRIPGLRRYTINRVAPAEAEGSAYYRMAELCFDSHDAAKAAMASPEWQHAFHDARDKIAGHVRLFFLSEEVPL